MATADLRHILPPQQIVGSVFRDRPIPSHKAAITKTPEIDRRRQVTENAAQLLNAECRLILGIGNVDFIYGDEEDLVYKTHPQTCASLSTVKPYDEHHRQVQRRKYAKTRLWQRLPKLRSELGSSHLKRLFAIALDNSISDFVRWAYAGWYHHEVQLHLDFWVKHVFADLVDEVITAADGERGGQVPGFNVYESDLHKWHETAVSRLGALRVEELFDIVVEWPATELAIIDLKAFCTNPSTRSYLTDNFSSALSRRLLHPGASTIEILQIYISIIRAFAKLDSKGILLERVSRKLRRYLRERDDTVRVLVAGLLAEIVEKDGELVSTDPDVLYELAIELTRRDEEDKDNHGELDWNNMEWQPDPIDAAPDYLKSKNTDVISSLTSLFDSKDVFVKELQTTLADRLLKNKTSFDQEISVLEHLKLRFGETALQSCEVMLRDVLDSRKVDAVILKDTQPPTPTESTLHAKILSRLFWPTLPDQSFVVPPSVDTLQQTYSAGFENLKQSRKLTWLNLLGHVEVELTLQDRTFSEEVLPWQASVIYAFHSTTETTEASISHTITSLSSTLQMSPTLVQSALTFWVSRQILTITSRTSSSTATEATYTVLETLPPSSTNTNSALPSTSTLPPAPSASEAASLAAAESTASAQKAQNAIYEQFILSMLTNQGAMPLMRISMMLNLVVPGGFVGGNEELKELLNGMVKEGGVDVSASGVYKKA